jgi:hypothetical protein
VAQVIQENGALSAHVTHGDRGCAVGIPQRYVCTKLDPSITASTWLADNPAWYSWRIQVDWTADRMAAAYARYNGDIKRAVVSHNCPACADAKTDRHLCVLNKTELKKIDNVFTDEVCTAEGGRVSRYFADEVSSKLTLLER